MNGGMLGGTFVAYVFTVVETASGDDEKVIYCRLNVSTDSIYLH